MNNKILYTLLIILINTILIGCKGGSSSDTTTNSSSSTCKTSSSIGTYDIWEYIKYPINETINFDTFTKDITNSTTNTTLNNFNYVISNTTSTSQKIIKDYTSSTDDIGTVVAKEACIEYESNKFTYNIKRKANIGDSIGTQTSLSQSYTSNITLSNYYTSFQVYNAGSYTTYTDVIEFTYKTEHLGDNDIFKNYYSKTKGFIGSINRDCTNSSGLLIDNLTICVSEKIYYNVK